ncbi:protein Spindly-like [Drosophila madeirensis]|uniref:Protein Spindly-like n=1 Tax=Drosophila madeirensis TaxID=30013 RepID=A0AAU9G3Y2_DROMD
MKGTPIKTRIKVECECSEEADEEEEENPVNDQSIDNAVKPVMEGTPIKPRLGFIKVKSNELLMAKQAPVAGAAKSKARKGTPLKQKELNDEDYDSDVEESSPAKPLRKGTPVREPAMQDTTNKNVRFILSKKRETFAEDSHKMVQFSGSSPVLHNPVSPVEQLQTEEAKKNETPTIAAVKDIKPTIKGPNIIRRIVIGSRQPKK